MKHSERVKRLETRRPAAPIKIVMVWNDDDQVDDDGEVVTAAEWRRRHPDARVINMTWGDNDED